jgi:hypothetical protein
MRNKESIRVIVIPRKLFIAWIMTTVLLSVAIGFSFQYTNYVDRRSNGLWCGVIKLFDDTYKSTPPPSDTGKILAQEFARIRQGFKCT